MGCEEGCSDEEVEEACEEGTLAVGEWRGWNIGGLDKVGKPE
jgi:hypothetical protein